MLLRKWGFKASVSTAFAVILLLSFATAIFADVMSPVTNLHFTGASRYTRTLEWNYPPNATPRDQVVVRSIHKKANGEFVTKDVTLMFGTNYYIDSDYVSGEYMIYVVFMKNANGSNMSSAASITYVP